MDLVGAISSLRTSSIVGQLQLRVARKILDDQQLEGSAAIKLIEAASNGVSQAGDTLAARATGLGGLLDVQG